MTVIRYHDFANAAFSLTSTLISTATSTVAHTTTTTKMFIFVLLVASIFYDLVNQF